MSKVWDVWKQLHLVLCIHAGHQNQSSQINIPRWQKLWMKEPVLVVLLFLYTLYQIWLFDTSVSISYLWHHFHRGRGTVLNMEPFSTVQVSPGPSAHTLLDSHHLCPTTKNQQDPWLQLVETHRLTPSPKSRRLFFCFHVHTCGKVKLKVNSWRDTWLNVLTLTERMRSGRSVAAPDCQQKPDLLPASACRSPVHRPARIPPQPASSIANSPGGSDHLWDTECLLEGRKTLALAQSKWPKMFSSQSVILDLSSGLSTSAEE